ncbi:Uncharacterized protein ALO83_02222 [Pseudomonas cannabina pv. alisalensis]|uniref:DNA-binding protein n=1 Tax=Pseudomonas cannabina TaxID=86840 RepID=A0A3M3RHJ5_PSECA|nr:Uncharacterized protein AC507_0003 [Pseudomonas syringae pv. maculicola]KPW19801.1 Uncharacterized protein ALO83_02222 [Pseudomonas cannabina pv. alisalensis]RMN78310.1 hypothetical protein ALQ52_01758 [Pseudomonas cannabina pv. alisalensis]RMN84332.1 hypothetical protein ALQ53_01883 [Pseudomonas cannabina]RMN95875.1 hypothetical protein ALQ51_03822 [Pseudomonas cannabina]
MEPEIIHIPELAKLLGRTESSIRSARQAGGRSVVATIFQARQPHLLAG